MKLLIISYSYAPDLTPRAFRWAAVIEHLAARGHQIHVLCSGRLGPAEQMGSDTSVRIYRVRDWLLNTSLRVTSGVDGVQTGEATKRRFTIRWFIRKIVRSIWRAIYWPDYSWGWLVPAVRTAKKLCSENDYDWIISVSHPFSGHVVGLAAISKSPNSRWFVDISDPYTDMMEPSPNNFLIYSSLNKAVESRIIERAEIVSVTTESTRSLYEGSFPIARYKLRVIPPLLSLPALEEEVNFNEDGVVRLVYIGTLYKSLRSPKFLLACMYEICRAMPVQPMELHFYGAVNDCQDDFLAIPNLPNCRIIVHGMVSRQEVVRAMTGANILVNIGNDSETQLASKVIEYMAMARPILNLVSIESDVSIDVLADYPSTMTVRKTTGEMPNKTVAEIVKFILNPPKVDPDTVERMLSRYSVGTIAGIYASLIESPLLHKH